MSLYKVIAATTRLIIKPFYKVETHNIDVPKEGAFIGVANHISYLDAVVIASSIKRPMRFVMYWKIYELPILNFFFKALGVISIAPPTESRKVYKKAVKEMDAVLQSGGAVFLFPEGMITHDGEMNEFKSGAIRLSQVNNCQIIPFGLSGLWGSRYSRAKLKNTGLKRRRITLTGGSTVSPEEVSRQSLFENVKALVD